MRNGEQLHKGGGRQRPSRSDRCREYGWRCQRLPLCDHGAWRGAESGMRRHAGRSVQYFEVLRRPCRPPVLHGEALECNHDSPPMHWSSCLRARCRVTRTLLGVICSGLGPLSYRRQARDADGSDEGGSGRFAGARRATPSASFVRRPRPRRRAARRARRGPPEGRRARPWTECARWSRRRGSRCCRHPASSSRSPGR